MHKQSNLENKVSWKPKQQKGNKHKMDRKEMD